MKTPRTHLQRGQAMTEFVMGAVLFLIPVFLIVPMLGKYLDVKSSTIQAARYVAWERTVWYGGASASVSWPSKEKTDGEIQNEIRRRIFSENSAISNADKSATSWAGAGRKALWSNHNGTAMLQNYGDVVAAVSNDDTPGIANDILNLAITVADALGPFTLEMKGMYTGQVSTSVRTAPINMSLSGNNPLNLGTLTFTDKNVIVSNTWSANGKAHVREQTIGLAPLGIFQKEPLKTVLTVLQVVMTPFAPEFAPGWLDIGKVADDVVPPDRLGQ